MGFAEEAIDDISIEEYLEGEKESPVKHEYIDGVVYAMAGASDRHIRIAGNIYNRLDNHLEDNPCEPFIADMKVWANEKVFYYPDVVVACEGANADPYYRKQPRLIVEVTSPSTENIDRSEKLLAYKQIKSLKEYVIVSQDSVRVDVFRRMRGDRWQLEIFTDVNEEVRFDSVGLTLSVASIYRRVKFPKQPKKTRVIPFETR
ncbi:MAG: Uma2 family endonuclease [Blastocatellia bacterium]